jgi:hypothetical protein
VIEQATGIIMAHGGWPADQVFEDHVQLDRIDDLCWCCWLC